MKILINLVTSIFLIILMALFDYNKINLIIYVILSILCLILNFSLKKMKNTDMWDIELEGVWLDIHTK